MCEDGLDYVKSSGPAGVLWDPFSKQIHCGSKKKKKPLWICSDMPSLTQTSNPEAFHRGLAVKTFVDKCDCSTFLPRFTATKNRVF